MIAFNFEFEIGSGFGVLNGTAIISYFVAGVSGDRANRHENAKKADDKEFHLFLSLVNGSAIGIHGAPMLVPAVLCVN